MSLPLIVSTWSFGLRGNDAAWSALQAGGAALEAVESACRAVEDDPQVDSVGFGGLPDRDGAVTLDGCIMLAPGPGRCGGAAALRHCHHPVSVARRVMERTPHILLAGEGADRFAIEEGFTATGLLSDDARAHWHSWRISPQPIDQSRDRGTAALRPVDTGSGGRLFHHAAGGEPDQGESRWRHHDTIGVLALDRGGVMAGACSTSGTPYKRPGRVGDSPIIGHGLYVDPAAGGATATGTGELIMSVCGSFLAVEEMRRGRSPIEALREAIERIGAAHALQPEHQVAMIALRADGAWAAAALRDGFKASVRDRRGARVTDPEFVAE